MKQTYFKDRFNKAKGNQKERCCSQMKKSLIIFCSIFLLTLSLKTSANGYKIQVRWEGFADSTVYLAHYYGSDIYVNDTIKLDNKGFGTATGDSLLKQGLYLIFGNQNAYFEFLLGADQDFKLQTSSPKFNENLKIEGSIESQKFRAYQQFVVDLRAKQQPLKDLKTKYATNPDSVAFYSNKLDIIDSEMSNYIQTETSKLPGTLYASFLKATYIPPFPKLKIPKTTLKYDSIAWFAEYNFIRDNYLSSIDFTDERLLLTPIVKQRLTDYFNNMLIQSPDSIIKAAHSIIEKARPNKNMFQYVTTFVLNNSLESKIMGMDAVFVDISESIYLKGQAFWADSTTLNNIYREVYITKQNLIGKIAPELKLEDVDGKIVSLHGVLADYTILVFWEPDCGHCKKEIPKLNKEVFLPRMSKNIQVYAVLSAGGNEYNKWKEFINQNELSGWINVQDTTFRSGMQYKYHLTSNPQIYLLDKQKKIIAKRIDSDVLKAFLDTLLKGK